MCVINITDEDIERVENKFGISFDDESKEFIKCLEPKDIQACPGAGKTTSLVAKLEILSNYMPFSDNSGVLVLTHTNVAVDEIKKKLGANAQKILSYPNHVGTFQSFVNKYLAIPMYIKLFGKKPERIDSDIFSLHFQNKFDKVNQYHKNWLQERAEEKFVNVLKFIENLVINDNSIQYNGRNIITNSSSMFSAIKTITQIPNSIFLGGYLTYEHCYDLAVRYLEEYPQIIELFQKRFKYIFVDEAQDTDDRQFQILNSLFSESIIQRIGDNNQAIFNFSGQKGNGWQTSENHIEIKNTKRLSKLISDQIIKVALNPQQLCGNEGIPIQPTIFIFDNIEDVIPKFSELIIEHELHTHINKCFKVIGAVGKLNDNGHTLVNYFPNYSSTGNNSLEFNTLIEKLANIEIKNIQPKEYRKIILDIINDYLRIKNIKIGDKYFTKTSLLSFLKERREESYDLFKLNILNITKKLASQECVKDDIKILLQIFLDLFEETLDTDSLCTIIEQYKVDIESKSQKNIYKYENDNIHFDINISTIHKVKGETHTATLVVETFNRGYDLFHLLKLLQGKKFAGANTNKKKLIYVAMSRATHFLCLAIHREQKNGKQITPNDITVLENSGFKVIS